VFDIMKSTGGGQDELLSQLMAMVLDVRERARQKKDFATADSIRDGLAKLGIEIQDSAEGPKWKIKR
ncbi:MAG: cysteine--tRNA ligase, partial [Thermoplasmata archaeon]|nr:cysteine--tRNA ligase [Thermoplasmata archaeon]